MDQYNLSSMIIGVSFGVSVFIAQRLHHKYLVRSLMEEMRKQFIFINRDAIPQDNEESLHIFIKNDPNNDKEN